MEIVPDLHQLHIPIPGNPLGHLNVYAIRQRDGWALVDAGMNLDEAYRSLTEQITNLAGSLSNLKRIVVTHCHPDHFGLAIPLKADSGAQIMMHERDVEVVNAFRCADAVASRGFADWLISGGMPREEAVQVRQLLAGPDYSSGRRFVPDVALHGGEKLSVGRFTFEVVWTPGHSPGHVCLFEPGERILISGDHVLPAITPSVAFHPWMNSENPLAAFLASLRAVAELDASLVLPAHEHSFNNLRGRIEEIIQHHSDRCDAILASIDGSAEDAGTSVVNRIVGRTGKTAYQISSELSWADGAMKWAGMPLFHRMLALEETLAHLHFIRAEGLVEVISDDGTALWGRRPLSVAPST